MRNVFEIGISHTTLIDFLQKAVSVSAMPSPPQKK